jgi:hypothetical protein
MVGTTRLATSATDKNFRLEQSRFFTVILRNSMKGNAALVMLLRMWKRVGFTGPGRIFAGG